MTQIKLKIVLLLCATTIVKCIQAQSFNLGTWNILQAKYVHNGKLTSFAEAQIRSLSFYNQFHYYEVKGGAEYTVNGAIKLALGIGTYNTYPEGGNFKKPIASAEIRVWPQLVIQQTIGKIRVEQRYRTELRYTNTGYRSRYRYRVGASIPFGKKVNQTQPFQFNLNSELFIGNKAPYFQRVRTTAALAYHYTKRTTLQLGYVHQFDYRINDETGRNFMQVGVFFTYKNKKKVQTVPYMPNSNEE